jgi:hypothetical protein
VASSSGNVFVNRTQIDNNSSGFIVDGSLSTVGVNSDLRDSGITGSSNNGITALSIASHAAATISVDNVFISFNVGSGINANGTSPSGLGSALVRIGHSTIANNVTGVSVTGSGQVKSFGNNQLNGNLTDGAFTPPNLGQL